MCRIIIVVMGNIPLGRLGTTAWFIRVMGTELALPKVNTKPTYLKIPAWILCKPPLGYTYFLVTPPFLYGSFGPFILLYYTLHVFHQSSNKSLVSTEKFFNTKYCINLIYKIEFVGLCLCMLAYSAKTDKLICTELGMLIS